MFWFSSSGFLSHQQQDSVSPLSFAHLAWGNPAPRCDDLVVLAAHRGVLALRRENLDPAVISANILPGVLFSHLWGCLWLQNTWIWEIGASWLCKSQQSQVSLSLSYSGFSFALLLFILLLFVIYLCSVKGRSHHRETLWFPCTSDLNSAKTNQRKYLESAFVSKQLQMQNAPWLHVRIVTNE